uniref:Cytochrome c biogenesis protein CcsB n=1 Tax=Centroceras clavulatum TaxID=159503 RepID=A0A4D6WN79_9FLOR|nr:cytochrome c biogenesis protein ccs1 [Centroceras clavulatum]
MLFKNKKNISWIFIKVLANLNFAISILFLVLFSIMLGSIIEQDQSLNYYKFNYPIIDSKFLYLNWRLITFLGLDRIYESWWFIFILFILCCSLIICTFSVQLPSLRNARRWKFIDSNKSKNNNNQKQFLLNNNIKLDQSLINIISCLNYQGYYSFNRKDMVYAYKGLIGRIAPIIVHISLLIILIGSTIGFAGGFTAQEMVPKGEIFHIKNVINSGFNNTIPIDFTFHVESFNIKYNYDYSIQQFFSKVSFIHNRLKNSLSYMISVNFPLRFRGVTLYQTDWQINALRIQIDSSSIIQYTLNKVQIGKSIFWICRLPINAESNIFLILTRLNSFIYLYNDMGEFVHQISLNQVINLDQTYFRIIEIMTSTGLQLKVDPGLFYVYIGFGLLIVSTFVSYISYSQIWFSIKNDTCYLAGSTNRAILDFEEEFQIIQKRYIKNCLT